MWLFILLAVLVFTNGYGMVQDHKYTNTWTMQINANVTEATRIAKKYGFTYKMKVCYRQR